MRHVSQTQKKWRKSQKRIRIIDTIFIIYTYLYKSPQYMYWYHCIPIAYISIIYMIPYIPYLKLFWYHCAYGIKILKDLNYILTYYTSITKMWYSIGTLLVTCDLIVNSNVDIFMNDGYVLWESLRENVCWVVYHLKSPSSFQLLLLCVSSHISLKCIKAWFFWVLTTFEEQPPTQ
jgi:hypothetical protein